MITVNHVLIDKYSQFTNKMTNSGDSNDPGTPSAYHWGPEQIDQWITGLGFPQYRETFKANFITGKKLVLLDASRLSQVNYPGSSLSKKIKLNKKLQKFQYLGYLTPPLTSCFRVQIILFT